MTITTNQFDQLVSQFRQLENQWDDKITNRRRANYANNRQLVGQLDREIEILEIQLSQFVEILTTLGLWDQVYDALNQ